MKPQTKLKLMTLISVAELNTKFLSWQWYLIFWCFTCCLISFVLLLSLQPFMMLWSGFPLQFEMKIKYLGSLAHESETVYTARHHKRWRENMSFVVAENIHVKLITCLLESVENVLFSLKMHFSFNCNSILHSYLPLLGTMKMKVKWSGAKLSQYSPHYKEWRLYTPPVFVRLQRFLTVNDLSVFIYCSEFFDVDVLDRLFYCNWRKDPQTQIWWTERGGGWVK